MNAACAFILRQEKLKLYENSSALDKRQSIHLNFYKDEAMEFYGFSLIITKLFVRFLDELLGRLRPSSSYFSIFLPLFWASFTSLAKKLV